MCMWKVLHPPSSGCIRSIKVGNTPRYIFHRVLFKSIVAFREVSLAYISASSSALVKQCGTEWRFLCESKERITVEWASNSFATSRRDDGGQILCFMVGMPGDISLEIYFREIICYLAIQDPLMCSLKIRISRYVPSKAG